MSTRKSSKQMNIRFTPEALELLKIAAQKLGVTQTAIAEMAVREFAEARGIKLQPEQVCKPVQ